MRKLYIHKETKEVLHVSAFPETDLRPNADNTLTYEGTEVECITEHTEGFDWGDTWTPPPPPHVPTFDEKLYTTKKDLYKALQEAHHEVLCATLPDKLTREQIEYILVNGIKPIGSQFWQKWEFTLNEAFYALPLTGPHDSVNSRDGRWASGGLTYSQTAVRNLLDSKKGATHPNDGYLPHGLFNERLINKYLSWKPVRPVPLYGVWESINGIGFLRFKDGESDENRFRDFNSIQSDNVRLRADWTNWTAYEDSSLGWGHPGHRNYGRHPFDATATRWTNDWCGYELGNDFTWTHGDRAEAFPTRPVNQFAWKIYERKA